LKKFFKSKVFNFLVFFILALVLLYYAFRSVDFKHIAHGFREVNYLWICASLLLGLGAHATRAIRWGYLMEPLGQKPSFGKLLSAVFVGYIANLALPRFGEVAKCGSVSKVSNLRFDSLVGTVVVERTADVAMLLLSTLIVILIQLDTFGQYIYSKIIQPIHERVLQVEGYKLVIILIMIAAFLFLVRFFLRTNILGDKINGKIKGVVNGLVEGLKSIYTTPKLFSFILLSFLMWVLYWAMTWALLKSLPITSGLSPWDAMFIMVIGSYGMTVPVQGGFGAYHIITASALGLFGLEYENGLIFSIVSHESQTIMLIVGGIVALVYLYMIQQKQDRLRSI